MRPPSFTHLRALLLGLTLVAGTAGAQQDDCGPNQEGCIAVGSWEFSLALGAGARTNPLRGADAVPLVLIPQVSYYGERVFIDNLELGVTLVDRPEWMVNALITPGRDGLYFFQDDWGRFVLDGGVSGNLAAPTRTPQPGGSNDSPTEDNDSAEVPGSDQGAEDDPDEPAEEADPDTGETAPPGKRDRHIAALAGLEASGDLGRFRWQAQALTDVAGVHEGEELRMALGTGTRIERHRLGLSLGLSWKSAEVMQYYYGISEAEAGEQQAAYRPGSGSSPFVRLNWSRPAGERWQWQGSVQYEHLSDAVRRSPLTDEGRVIQVFFGGVYHF